MEETQSLSNRIENELGFEAFDLFQFDSSESLHADDPEFPKTFDDAVRDIEYDRGTIGLKLAWMSDFTSFGGQIQNSEDKVGAFEPELPCSTKSEKLANGRSIDSYLHNLFAHNNPLETVSGQDGSVFTASQTPTERSNGQRVNGDFALSKQQPDIASEVEICLEKRKVGADFPANDQVDGVVVVSDDENTQTSEMGKRRPFDSADNFGSTKKAKRSDSSTRGGEDLLGIRTDRKRDSLKASGFGVTSPSSFVSSKATTRSKRGAKTRKSRNASVESSPAPSPMSDVCPASPNDTTRFIYDHDLVSLDTKELNKRVKSLPKRVVDEIKHRRRTLKNRGYARSCREKKISETSTLQRSNGDLERELSSKRLELELALLQRDEWKGKYERLVLAIMKRQDMKFTNSEA